MDATPKRKVWKVAICYFLFSTLVFANIMLDGSHRLTECLIPFFCYLQPICYYFATEAASKNNHLLVDSITMSPNSVAAIAEFLSVLIWCLCFGWIYTKIVNWLNHFPVLGKKVF